MIITNRRNIIFYLANNDHEKTETSYQTILTFILNDQKKYILNVTLMKLGNLTVITLVLKFFNANSENVSEPQDGNLILISGEIIRNEC